MTHHKHVAKCSLSWSKYQLISYGQESFKLLGGLMHPSEKWKPASLLPLLDTRPITVRGKEMGPAQEIKVLRLWEPTLHIKELLVTLSCFHLQSKGLRQSESQTLNPRRVSELEGKFRERGRVEKGAQPNARDWVGRGKRGHFCLYEYTKKHFIVHFESTFLGVQRSH